MRKPAVVTLAFVLLIALGGCGDDGEKADGTTGGDQASGDVGKAPGVTADSIKVGVTYADLEAIRDIIDLDYGDYEAIYQALFDDINERGGINGRQLEPVYAAVNPLGDESSLDTCKKLTEEDEVFVSIGYFSADNVLCHVEEHDSAVLGGTMTEERLAKAKAPWFTVEPSGDLQSEAIREFDEAELFDEKFAVYLVSTDKALYDNLIVPALEEFDLEPVDTGIIEADPNDAAAAEGPAIALAERFEAAGATKVLVVGEGSITWANALQEVDYRPQSLFTSGLVVNQWINGAGGKDVSVLDGSVSADIYGGRNNQFNEPNMQLCIGGPLKDHGIEIPEPTDAPAPAGTPDPFTGALTACKTMALLEGLLTNVEGELGYESFRATADAMNDLPMPGSDQAYRYGDPPHADGDAPASLFDYNAAARAYLPRET